MISKSPVSLEPSTAGSLPSSLQKGRFMFDGISSTAQTDNGAPAIAAGGLRNPSINNELPRELPSVLFIHQHQPGILEKDLPPDGQEILPWGWGAQRKLSGFSNEEIQKKLVNALEQCSLFSDALKVKACQREFVVVACADCGLPVAVEKNCHNRLCPFCAHARTMLLISEHEEKLKQIRYPKMIVLSWPSVKQLNREWFRKARKDLEKLRHSKMWSESVFAGLGSFEFTYSKKYGWHPHWHCLAGAKYINQADLSRVWGRISGAPVVWITSVKDNDRWEAVKEIIKYPAKCADFIDEPALVKEFLEASKGVKMVTGFGALYRVSTKNKSGKKITCPRCGCDRFEWSQSFTVNRERVRRYKDGWVLNDSLIRAGPVPGGS